jgi:ABC-type iron transport system FetAB permease component
MFMIVLAAREAFARPQYHYKDVFWHICATLTFSCFFLTMFGTALGMGRNFSATLILYRYYVLVLSVLTSHVAPCFAHPVIMVVPFWNPRYFIPVLAMLLGNSIGAITIGLVCLDFVCY